MEEHGHVHIESLTASVKAAAK